MTCALNNQFYKPLEYYSNGLGCLVPFNNYTDMYKHGMLRNHIYHGSMVPPSIRTHTNTYRSSLDPLCSKRAGCNGWPTAKCLESGVNDLPIIIHLDLLKWESSGNKVSTWCNKESLCASRHFTVSNNWPLHGHTKLLILYMYLHPHRDFNTANGLKRP